MKVLGLAAVAAFLVCLPVWAAAASDPNASDGSVSIQLSSKMYCDVRDLVQGDIGLLLGLVLVFMGIWSMVQGAKIVAVLPIIIIGSLVTALPSLIEETFKGLGGLLSGVGISQATYKAPTPEECKKLEDIKASTIPDYQRASVKPVPAPFDPIHPRARTKDDLNCRQDGVNC